MHKSDYGVIRTKARGGAKGLGMLKNVGNMKSAMVGLVILGVAGCSATFQNHGYAPSETDLAEVVIGVDTADTVAQAVGRPTSTGILEGAGWYYSQSRWRHYAFKAPKVIDRQVVAISFDDNGVVQNVERFTLEDGRVVPLTRRVTESNVKGITLIQQLLRNIGNVQAGEILNK